MRLTLETDRLILRPFEMSDADEMFNGWASNPEVTKYLTWDTHKSIDETRYVLEMWIKEYEDPKRLNFAIVLKGEGRLIGGIDVVRYEDGMPVIGYNLSRTFWNNGYMTEACRCLLNYLFTHGYSAVRIDAIFENIGSNRVIRKCGGVFQETVDEYLKFKNRTVKLNRYIVRAE